MLKYKYIFQIKYTEAILSTSTRKLLWFEITKTLIVVKKIYCVIYYNFRHTFVPYWTGQFGQRFIYCGMVESTRCTTTQSLLGTLYTVCQYRARQLREAMLLLMLRVVLPCVVGQRGPDSPSTSHQLSTISVDGLFSQVEAEHASQHHDNAATDHANTTVNSTR